MRQSRPIIETRDGRRMYVGCLPDVKPSRPKSIYQLAGQEVATLAYTKSEARAVIRRLLGVARLPAGSEVVKVRTV